MRYGLPLNKEQLLQAKLLCTIIMGIFFILIIKNWFFYLVALLVKLDKGNYAKAAVILVIIIAVGIAWVILNFCFNLK